MIFVELLIIIGVSDIIAVVHHLPTSLCVYSMVLIGEERFLFKRQIYSGYKDPAPALTSHRTKTNIHYRQKSGKLLPPTDQTWSYNKQQVGRDACKR